MIRASIDVEGMRIAIDGHAGYAPAGQDIVCAAVSALACTLAGNLDLMLCAEDYTADLAEGRAFIEARPPAEMAEDCRKLFMFVANGLCMLAAQYGNHIQLEGE